jgi:acyl-CoA thioester hydrolase
MITGTSTRRVLYAETDRMGFLYYGNYPAYYEIGRTELLRKLGTSYKILEETGVQMPVRSLEIEYIKPAAYDDLLTIRARLTRMPGVRMHFYYEIENESGEVINRGRTELVFTRISDNKPVRPPDWFMDLLRPYFKE